MQFEQFSPAPYPLGTDIRVNGVSLREMPEAVTVERQSLSMERGELTTNMLFQPSKDLSLHVEVLQFASRSVPCLVCQQIAIRPNGDAAIGIITHIDIKDVPVTEYAERTREITGGWYSHDPVDQVKAFQTGRSRLGVALSVPRSKGLNQEEIGRYSINGEGGQTYFVQTIASMVSELYHFEPHLEAIRLVRWGEMLGFDRLRKQNQQAWADLWQSRIKVTGCTPEDQRALDVAFYYLHSNVHPSTMTGTPPFGLTQYWAYYGHNFWDTDIWMLIPTVLVQPEAARATIEYRFRGLDSARKRAKLFGYRGAQYPWEAAPLNGAETTPCSCPTGWAQQHTTPGVAIGAWEYQLAAGDPMSLRELTWPILKAVAEWIESRGEFTERGFEFRMMMGPDEHINDVSNQTYFNLLSRKAMYAAVACARKIGYEPPKTWEKIAKTIFIPMDKEKDIVLPYDPDSTITIFDESRGAFVQAPAMLEEKTYSLGNLHWLFVHGNPVPDDVFRNTFFHEERIRLARDPEPSVPGSVRAPGFTSPIYMACAAFCGERQKSAELFLNSWKPYWLEPFGMTREYQSQNYGSYLTTFGGLLQATMLGLTGVRISEDDWCKYPAALPEGWEKIEIDRICVKGESMKVVAEHGKKAVLSPCEES
jgi:trehalose/maltose hydrolase-like predicted phosphorylase